MPPCYPGDASVDGWSCADPRRAARRRARSIWNGTITVGARTIDIEHFVDLADVDPIFFDHPYLVAPAAENEGALRACRLLLEVMNRTDRAALGRFVMRTKEYVAIVRARDDVLAPTTMLFHDEVRPAEDIDAAADITAREAHVRAAARRIEGMTVEWRPERYSDYYRIRLQRIVARKRKGGTIKMPKEVEEPTPVPDLMAALRESLQPARQQTPRRDSGRTAGSCGAAAAGSGKSMELGGLEPPTSWVRSRRSPN